MDRFDELEASLDEFADDRDWRQFHSVRNLVLAIVGEVGELAELVQWQDDRSVESALKDPDFRSRFEEELADVLLYLVRLATISSVDLPEAARRKLLVNAERYPVERSKGTARKYDEF